jgi:hypothetical protein
VHQCVVLFQKRGSLECCYATLDLHYVATRAWWFGVLLCSVGLVLCCCKSVALRFSTLCGSGLTTFSCVHCVVIKTLQLGCMCLL